jgi:hypothetical protein
MTINNTALFDAALAGLANSNRAWLTDQMASDYATQVNAAVAIATAIDSKIPTIVSGVSISQRDLLAAITQNVMSDRSPVSMATSTYLDLAISIAAIFTEFSAQLLNSD